MENSSQQIETPTREPIKDSRKCKVHNMWMRKGVCSVCYLEKRKAQNEDERLMGSYKPAIKITKV